MGSIQAVLSHISSDGIWVCRNAVILSACRGKLTDKAPSEALGVLSDAFVPQKWFSHFYIVGSVWNAVVLYVVYRSRTAVCSMSLLHSSTLVLFQVHVVRRFIETVYVMKYPKDARMHMLAYVFGLSYYIMVPMTYGYQFLCMDTQTQCDEHPFGVREIMVRVLL
jgi:3-oxo-5-alpha-steroid 4-dehydrogenase 3